MKYLVLTVAVGKDYERIFALTGDSVSNYAKRIGADFLRIDSSSSTTPHWEKFKIFDLLNQYNRIIFVDADILIREDCPNLFDLVPETKLGMFNEMPFTQGLRSISLIETCKDYGVELRSWNGKYYNTGVMVVSRMHKYLFKKPEKEIFNFYEQGYLNMILARDKVQMFDLPYKFNRMTCMDKYTGEERFASYIIHYAGYPSLDFVTDLIKNDKIKWNSFEKNHIFKRHILIDVQGGLGDQICAEPAIRFLSKYVYPNEDITIKTHYPRIFKHLKLPTFLHEDWIPKPDTPYYHVITLPGPETVTWSVVSNLLCHTVDYCSIALLRRTLPLVDKKVILEIDEDELDNAREITGVEDLHKLVLFHPGRHWESKTFPTEWWQKVLDGMVAHHLPICVIGQNEETRGVLDLKLPKEVIDTRDLLDVGTYLALISEANLVVSNDSSPIHIAGAFDTGIVLIPSCKHPDHLLPLERTRRTAVYKKLTLDECLTAPTEVHGSSGEFVKGNIYDYLPECEDVVETVVRMYRGEKQ